MFIRVPRIEKDIMTIKLIRHQHSITKEFLSFPDCEWSLSDLINAAHRDNMQV